MKSVMSHSFSNNPSVEVPRSLFDRSHGYKTTFDAGYLIPFFVDDVLPGDTFNLNMTGFARLNTPLVPIMDNMFMDTHFFFVPYRLIWANSKKFFGERLNPTDTIDYSLPVMQSFTPVANSIHDYLGLPPGKTMTPVCLYHRAYNIIYREWFRDQNLQNSPSVLTGDGPDADSNYTLLRRGKRHDYFTSCLPWPQKGTAVSIPLGTSAPITHIMGQSPIVRKSSDLSLLSTTSVNIKTQATTSSLGDGTIPATLDFGSSHYVDLSTAAGATVNDLRESFQVQRLLERDARGGTRYSELVRNHFGVDFYDLTYRPEYLGGGSTPVVVSQVAATAASTGVAVGDLGAYGIAAFKNHGFSKSFNEHGIVMGIVSVRADLTYQQGVHRRFRKSTRYDIYWPTLAHLGEQEVYNSEIYFQGNPTFDNAIFGYQERYSEYRYMPSQITGMLRSSYATPLDVWHLSQNFSSLPVLGDTFIKEDPPVDRCIATPTEHHFVFDSYISLKCARPMPVFSVPGYIDRF